MRHTAQVLLAATALFMTSCASDAGRAAGSTSFVPGTAASTSGRYRDPVHRRPPSTASSATGPPTTTSTSPGTSLPSLGHQLPEGDVPVDLDPATFTADIDNPYWPMAPGTRWTYREIDEEGKELEVVVTVSSETKEIANGVTARVVRDTVTEDGELIEDTFDWYAQDDKGNIWYLGEDTAEFEGGKITTKAGSFEAGVDGALPGIIMPADPAPGMNTGRSTTRARPRTTARC